MIKNYVQVAFRHLFKNKLYSLINIGGLAVGIAVCLLMILFVSDELSFDKWITNAERIYKAEVTFKLSGQAPIELAVTQMPLGPALVRNYPDLISNAVRIAENGVTVDILEKKFNETIFYVDSDFFNVFDIPVIKGVRSLNSESDVLISETIAKKYFGNDDPIGKVVSLNNSQDFIVRGILADLPKNTHFQVSIVALLNDNSVVFQPFRDAWDRIRVHTYLKLKQNVKSEDIERAFPEFVMRNNVLRQMPGDDMEFNLIALEKIHLYGRKSGHLGNNGDINLIWNFSIIAILILLVASINFMNLSTAVATQRAREVSLRKVHGANPGQLIFQFLMESVLISFLALLLAVAVVGMTLPVLNDFLTKNLTLTSLSNVGLSLSIIVFTAVVGLLSGAYPAFVLSSFRPASVLRSNKSGIQGTLLIRNILVVAQFSISIGLMLATSYVYVQTNFLRHTELGYNAQYKLNLLNVPSEKVEALKNVMGGISGISDVTMAKKAFPFNSGGSYEKVNILGSKSVSEFNAEVINIGNNFLQFFGINPIAGRIFETKFNADMSRPGKDEEFGSANVVVNQTFTRNMGYTEASSAIGQVVRISAQNIDAIIVGVLPDIYIRSLHSNIGPMIFMLQNDSDMSVMTLNVSNENNISILRDIDKAWQSVVTDKPINRQFVSDGLENLYSAEDRRLAILKAFTVLAIFVACLGLYGLASHNAERRTKEIGIRKIMGASVFDIGRQMLWEISRLILVSCAIGILPALYFIHGWLQQFVIRINLIETSYLIILVPLISVLIAWFTVSGQVLKVTRGKPIDALRHD